MLPLQNSNLVLTAEQRTRGGKEPDGTAQSLWDNMAGRMGDRVQRNRPEGIDDKKKKKKRDNVDSEGFAIPKKRRVSRNSRVSYWETFSLKKLVTS
jgi:hypothetical protein